MKKIFIAVSLMISACASAQVINMPDANLRSYILAHYSYVDQNGDGQIEVNEAATGPQDLYIEGTVNGPITDFTGLSYFTYLNAITIMNSQATTIDLSGFVQLGYVQIMQNPLLTSVNFSGSNMLNHIQISQNNITHVDITGLPNLETFYCDFNPNLLSVNAENCAKLKIASLDGSGTSSSIFNLKNCDSLNTLFSTETIAQTLDISGCEKLPELRLLGDGTTNCRIGSLIANGCTSLAAFISINGSGVTDLFDLSGCTSLDTAYIGYCTVQNIDFSTCTHLHRLHLSNVGYGPTTINVKNGVNTDIFIDGFNATLNNLNICADDFEVAGITNDLTNYPAVLNINPYCSFLPAGAYNTIKGKIKVDLDNNGCSSTDPGLQNVPVRIIDNQNNMLIKYTGSTGHYIDYPYAGNFSITPYFAYPYFSLSPASDNINFNTAASLVDSADFCVTPLGTHNDLLVTLLPVSPARPGRTATYQLVYTNRGTTTQSGNVEVDFNNSKMIFTNASLAVDAQAFGQLNWNYSNLQPFESRYININFSLFAPPINNVNDTLIYLAVVNPTANDETAFDNSFVLPQHVVAAYDPNDKECLEGNKVDITALGKPLDYIIRFQNLGNDTAFNIVVTDQLSNKLDWNSVEITATSNPCSIQQKDGKMEFVFENINLPYATINEPASHGFVAFRVKPNSNLFVGDSINNKAAIYFDFNLPVITNTATTIVTDMAVVPVRMDYFSLSNKDKSNFLTWKVTTTDLSTTFNVQRSSDGIHFSDIGNITATAQRCQLPFNFTDGKPLTGKNYYRIKITDANGVSFYSKILVTGNTKSGFAINAVASNQNNTTLYLDVSKDQTVQMKIIAADGRLLYNESKSITAGTNQLDLQTGNLSKGIYTIVVYTNDGEIITKRFVK